MSVSFPYKISLNYRSYVIFFINVECKLLVYLFIGVRPLCLSRTPLGRAIWGILLVLTLLILRILWWSSLARTCGINAIDVFTGFLCIFVFRIHTIWYAVWVALTISLRLPAVALLRGVLLLAEGLLLAWTLLIWGLLLTVLRVAWTYTSQVHLSVINCRFC